MAEPAATVPTLFRKRKLDRETFKNSKFLADRYCLAIPSASGGKTIYKSVE